MSSSVQIRSEHFAAGCTKLAYRLVGEGPLVVLLHGFPDTAETWEELQGSLARAGYTSAALHMRGYPPSDIPDDKDYSIPTLAKDALALIDHLGDERAAVVGHDWGAAAAYAAASLSPSKLSSVTMVAIPPLPVFRGGLRERWARPHNLYLGLGAMSEWWLERRSFAEIDRLYHKWSPSWTVPDGHLAGVKQSFAKPARARAAVDYYAAKLSAQDAKTIVGRIHIPTLVVFGLDEPRVRREMFERAGEALEGPSEILALEGVGHWPHLEDPERFSRALLSFLHANESVASPW